jgi:hypothetical protein
VCTTNNAEEHGKKYINDAEFHAYFSVLHGFFKRLSRLWSLRQQTPLRARQNLLWRLNSHSCMQHNITWPLGLYISGIRKICAPYFPDKIECSRRYSHYFRKSVPSRAQLGSFLNIVAGCTCVLAHLYTGMFLIFLNSGINCLGLVTK